MFDDLKNTKQLIKQLNDASNAYYNDTPIMTDKEWDTLYDKLKMLEQETGIIYPNSPTQNVGYKVVDSIKKVKLNHPMLSLDKCHTQQELIDFSDDKECLLSVKADGLSTSLHYIDGELVGAYTRGDGEIGGDVLNNVLTIKNIPKKIPYLGELIIDGETIIDWDTFNSINNGLPSNVEKYKHPRNLVSGSLNVLDSKVAATRNMRFVVWRVIKCVNTSNTVLESFHKISKLGFEVIPYLTYCNRTDKQYLGKMLSKLQSEANKLGIPYDGIVMTYNDIKYGMSLGRTTKFFRHSIAYKFEDQEFATTLKDIEWSIGKTGQITPVAIFEPIEIDGTQVERASVHNISILTDLDLQVGDTITVYKANQIIPQIKENLSSKHREPTYIRIPPHCPVCNSLTEIRRDNNTDVLYCTNDNCKGKLLGKLVHAVSKSALNIDGLSESTIEKFIKSGWVDGIASIYGLKKYYEKMIVMSGFGVKSVNKLFQSIEDSKNTTLDRFIYAHSIPLIGKTASKLIAKDCNYNFDLFVTKLSMYREKAFEHIEGFGSEMGLRLYKWFVNHGHEICSNAKLFNFVTPENDTQSTTLSGKVFCITGTLNIYKNREELKSALERAGAKVVNSVTSKTTYLINNDINSTSSKNKKAKDSGISIITESEVKEMIN